MQVRDELQNFFGFRNDVLLCLLLGLVENAAETSSIALESCHSDGVYFIPAFSGLGVFIIFYFNLRVQISFFYVLASQILIFKRTNNHRLSANRVYIFLSTNYFVTNQ